MAGGYGSREFTEEFLDSYSSRDFTPADRRLFKKALRVEGGRKRLLTCSRHYGD